MFINCSGEYPEVFGTSVQPRKCATFLRVSSQQFLFLILVNLMADPLSSLLNQPVAKCIPYDNQLDRYRHGRTRCYEQQIERYLNQHVHKMSADAAYSYSDIPDLRALWSSKKYFQNRYYEIRSWMSRSANEDTADIVMTPTVATQRTIPSDGQYKAAITEI